MNDSSMDAIEYYIPADEPIGLTAEIDDDTGARDGRDQPISGR